MRTCVSAAMLLIVTGCAATGDFTRTTVDLGVVVSDMDKAAAFYKDGLGFTEVPGFDVPTAMAGDSGLSDYKPFHVRVMVLSDEETATKVKLVAFPDAPGTRSDNAFIHTTLGVSYLTLYVSDITAAVERARKAGAAPLAKGPILLPERFPANTYLALVRDPDGNMIELVGPKKE